MPYPYENKGVLNGSRRAAPIRFQSLEVLEEESRYRKRLLKLPGQMGPSG
jgi:hypothetical protein